MTDVALTDYLAQHLHTIEAQTRRARVVSTPHFAEENNTLTYTATPVTFGLDQMCFAPVSLQVYTASCG